MLNSVLSFIFKEAFEGLKSLQDFYILQLLYLLVSLSIRQF